MIAEVTAHIDAGLETVRTAVTELAPVRLLFAHISGK
ncbi:MAG: hypothetical protein JWO18_1270 [Microbacteriaceae bacterium]|nr:hypothetical protein [Microbacteriaceae bacterium]